VVATKIYLIRCLYNLRMKESDSITAHQNDYEGIISQLSAHTTTESSVCHEYCHENILQNCQKSHGYFAANSR
jgi:hypothetical protein